MLVLQRILIKARTKVATNTFCTVLIYETASLVKIVYIMHNNYYSQKFWTGEKFLSISLTLSVFITQRHITLSRIFVQTFGYNVVCMMYANYD